MYMELWSEGDATSTWFLLLLPENYTSKFGMGKSINSGIYLFIFKNTLQLGNPAKFGWQKSSNCREGSGRLEGKVNRWALISEGEKNNFVPSQYYWCCKCKKV